jgi:hypothetical protein
MNNGGGGGGGVREVGTVTGGMAMMNFDEKTRPYTREDFLKFMQNYDTNLNEGEKRLLEKGMAGTIIGMPATFFATYMVTKRLAWHRVMRMVPYPWIPKAGRFCLAASASTVPYMYVQSWFVNSVLALDSSSDFAFHLKRFMVTQRNGMMFSRTATREVTREEQQALSREATEHVMSNRMANRPTSNGVMDVNLALGGQVMLPPAQTGYKPLPSQQK